MLGHYALDCPKETGADMQQSTTLNMLSTQESSQEHHTLIDSLQNQVSLQHQLLVMQATLARQDEMLTSALGALGAPSHASTTMPQGVGMPLASPLLMGIGSAKKNISVSVRSTALRETGPESAILLLLLLLLLYERRAEVCVN